MAYHDYPPEPDPPIVTWPVGLSKTVSGASVRPGGYRPQLDSLRAFAVMAVMFHHYLPTGKILPEDFLTLGLLAVRLFFVLSGYLITGILLGLREMPLETALRRFYTRRALRILPIYYLTVIAASAYFTSARRFLGWHLAYLSNFAFVLFPGSAVNGMGHLWSLAVEEQFYCLWPLMILLVPYRHLARLLLTTLLTGIAYKAFVAFAYGPHLAGAMLTPACFDSLAIGGLLAFVEHDPALQAHKARALRLAAGAGLGIVLIQVALFASGRGLRLFWTTDYLGVSLLFVWLIGRAADGFGGLAGKLLQSKSLLGVGKISYGVYVYHNFMPMVSGKVIRLAGFSDQVALSFPLNCALTLAVAACSWKLIERPINDLKNRDRFQPR